MSGDGYEYDNEDEGMRGALERARDDKRSHIDEAVASLDHETPKDDLPGFDTAPKLPDDQTAAPPKPEVPKVGPVEPPPNVPGAMGGDSPKPEQMLAAGVAPTPDPAPFKPNDFGAPLPAAPAAPGDDQKAMRMKAIDTIRRLADYNPTSGATPPGMGDAELAAAQQHDTARSSSNDIFRSIQSMLYREPFKPSEPNEAANLVQRRQLADSEYNRQMTAQERQMTAQERLAAALKGDKEKDPGALSEFQKYEMDRNAREDTDKKAAAAKKTTDEATQLDADRENLGTQLKSMGLDPTKASQKDIDRAISLQHTKATEDLARAQFSDKTKQEDKRATEGLPVNMELVTGANPQPDQLKALGTVDHGAGEVHQLANRMRALVKEDGVFERAGRVLPTDKKRLLTQIQGEMTIALKDSAALGQISAGDQALIDSIRPEATGADSLLRDPASFEKQLNGMEQWANDKRSEAMKTIGARTKGGGGVGGGKVVVRKGKETLSIDPSDLAAAQADGYARVQ